MTTPAAWGVATAYRDAFGERQRIPARAQRRVLAAMGVPDDASPPAVDPVRVAGPDTVLGAPAVLVLEDGSDLGVVRRLPLDLPIGYHHLRTDAGDQLLLTPPRSGCHLPRGLRAWGWTAQLYALRSAGSWGIGDFGDLRQLADAAAASGAGFVAISPTCAPNPGPVPEASPYFPSTRRFLNPLHLRMDALSAPPSGAAVGELAALAARGRALNADRRIDRPAVAALKQQALELLWSARDTGVDRRVRAFRRRRGPALRRWATFCALAERHGPGWRSWPEAYRRPRSAVVARYAAENAERVQFHEWVQLLLDEQMAAAGEPLRIVNDLPVGTDPGGFDAWDWQDVLSDGATFGVPADRFNLAGQDWGMRPFVPHRLRAAGLGPFVETVRASMRHAGGLRLDHVLGLFRQWWIPRGDHSTAGAYVRYPADELLAVLAIESERAGAVVIGEDLGTVPRGVRPRLARARVLGTRLLYFERRPPDRWSRRALAAINTHDLPTIAGAWTGVDLDDQRRAGREPDPAGLAHFRDRLAAATGLGSTADARDVILAAHRAIAASPCVLASATLEDALALPERPNIPGSVPPQRDNWSRALPLIVEELNHDPFVSRVAAAMRR